MDVYESYAKGHSRTPTMVSGLENQQDSESTQQVASNPIIINPLAGRLELTTTTQFTSKTTEEWINIFPNAAYFSVYDESLFGHIVTMIYENTVTNKICTVSVTKFGVTLYHDIILSQESRFYPACENLLPIHKDSKVRRALAITNLKNYNKLVNHPGSFVIERRWDETNAGALASKMALLVDKRPNEFGIKLLQLGLLSNHSVSSLVVDTVYNNSPSTTDQKMVQDNNKLVCLLGDQLDQLFDPLLEYSPEILEASYNVPRAYDPPTVTSEKIDNIVTELVNIQTNFTTGLVGLLQNFIIPLRVHILGLTDTQGITKINHIFPPTIDEVTRINCVLHDSLARATPFGYIEVIKVFGMILPYFYKPFVRHEANLKNFKSRFDRFHEKYNQVFQDPNINPSNYSQAYIDSVVTGSLLELPRLKLILTRLYKEIENGRKANDPDAPVVDYYYHTAISVIDAFGGEDPDLEPHLRSTSQRIFTPTGKLLTELAGNWPVELQYGWLTRKVIGIFELKNVKPVEEPFYDDEVLIIFSDHLLFLKIVDDQYYAKENLNDGSVQLRISDVLMHSLVNEKPLPKLSTFPKMVVSHWCDIDDVIASTYKSFSFVTSSEESFLRVLNRQGINSDGIVETYHYEVRPPSTGHHIIEMINKSQILHKVKPFHLFRTSSDVHVYTTAHSASSYDEEQTKSPIIVLLNMPESMIRHYFETNPFLFLVLTVTYTYDGDIQLIGFNRNGGTEVNLVVPESKFQDNLTGVLRKFVNCYFNSYEPMTEMMIKSTYQDLSWYLQTYQSLNGYEMRERFKRSARKSEVIEPVEEPQENVAVSSYKDYQQTKGQTDELNVSQNKNNQKQVETKKKRRSFFRRLFGKKEPKKLEYKELYRPHPKLEMNEENEPNQPQKQEQKEVKPDIARQPTPEIEPDLTRYDSQADTIHYHPRIQVDAPEQQAPPPEQSRLAENGPVDHLDQDILDETVTIKDVEAAKLHQKQEADKRVSSQAEILLQDEQGQEKSFSKPGLLLGTKAAQESQESVPVSNSFYPQQNKKPFKELYESDDTLEYLRWTNEPQEVKEDKSSQERFIPKVPAPIKVVPKKKEVKEVSEIEERLYGRSARQVQPQAQPQAHPKLQYTETTPSTPSHPKQASLDVTKNFEFPSPTKSTFEETSKAVGNSAGKSGTSGSTGTSGKSSAKSPIKVSEANSNNSNSYPASTIRQVDTFDDVSVFGPFFYDDGEANWVQFSRDSSTISVNEPKKLQFPPRLTSFSSSIHSRLEDANFGTKIRSREVSAAESFKSQIVFFNSQVGRNDSTNSLSTASFVNEFSREIDFNFKSAKPEEKAEKIEVFRPASPKKIESVFSKPEQTEYHSTLAPSNAAKFEPSKAITKNGSLAPSTANTTTNGFVPISVPKQRKRDVYDANEVPRRYSGMTTSDDEFYSIEGSPRSRITRSPMTPHAQDGSFSSENTIINELLHEPKTKNIYMNQFESMAYLSDVLNGTVNFDV